MSHLPIICSILTLGVTLIGAGRFPRNGVFKAAVYEHTPVVSQTRSGPSLVKANLDIYEEQVLIAASQSVNVIVFPEYGLTGLGWSRDSLREVAEVIPDPNEEDSIPCDLPDSNLTQVQQSLSCLAKENNMYIAVNMVSWEQCSPVDDEDCPGDHFYLYNTNVVYDMTGKLVGRYRKWTLYYETALNEPKAVEHDYFDTPYGRMGTFICFDVLFEKPAIDLVEKYEIDTALFPTAWQSKLPLMQGVGFHESWSILTGTNLLSSELHIPSRQYAGSGINIGNTGAASYYFDDDILSPPVLLISELPIKPSKPIDTDLPHPPPVTEEFDVFDSTMRGDPYRFIALEWNSNEVYIQDENTTCYLNYSFAHRDHTELYALAVFQGLHLSAHNSYLQVCTVIKCGDINNRDSCGDSVREANSAFSKFTLHGQFSTRYVFPSVVVDGAVPTGNRSGWEFVLDSVTQRSIIELGERPLVYAALYGRVFERDTQNPSSYAIGSSGTHTAPFWIGLLGFFLTVKFG
ncbi:hypothetical protein CAPTEDRAFT_168223 [Capitella teleta]|uniref:CN hydrolase domain-containing protein n=1 Tax=Capitella teleta TaxID=283909 RepID=R7UE11_CAPTE|nr:hypothetical protein CAPTEDRAFT_168223 [Capitella teleta]|eukprot:ELU04224.1 hypothetical protein CAPTEDRAFT_168223 [Capitella teleta]